MRKLFRKTADQAVSGITKQIADLEKVVTQSREEENKYRDRFTDLQLEETQALDELEADYIKRKEKMASRFKKQRVEALTKAGEAQLEAEKAEKIKNKLQEIVD